MNKQRWESPYQTAGYWDALAQTDIKAEQVTLLTGETIFFDPNNSVPTAWELDSSLTLDLEQIGPRVVFQRVEPEASMREDSYYTLALSPEDERYNNRFKRQLRKAQINLLHPRTEIAELPHQLHAAIDMFTKYPDRRDSIPMDIFRRRIVSLSDAGLLLAYVLRDDNQELGVSLVLKNGTHANLRYYTAERVYSAGHLLQASSIDNMFSDQGISTVDLSGVSPHTDNTKLQGIDEFKYQIGGQLVEFAKIDGRKQ